MAMIEITKEEFKAFLLSQECPDQFALRDCETCPIAMFMHIARKRPGHARTYGWDDSNAVSTVDWPNWVKDYIYEWDRSDGQTYLKAFGPKDKALELLEKGEVKMEPNLP